MWTLFSGFLLGAAVMHVLMRIRHAKDLELAARVRAELGL